MKHIEISIFLMGAMAITGLAKLGQPPDETGPKPDPEKNLAQIKCDIRSWDGVWQTNWGVMNLKFDDESFSGIYGPSKHAVRGRFDPKSPCVLRGVWQHTGTQSAGGRFTFRIIAPGVFKGNWSSGDTDPDVAGSPWTGTRPGAHMVALPKNISLAQLKLEQFKHRAKLNSEYRKACHEMLNVQIAQVIALRKQYSQRRDNQKEAEATRMLGELQRLLNSLPPIDKRMPPEEVPDEGSAPDGPGLETPSEEPVPDVSEPGLVNDSKLEAVVRKTLGKPKGAITSRDLASLKKLEASFLGISDISGLEHATNLTSLNLSHNPISDITPLAGLTQLKRLLLYKVRITDLKPLADLTKVEFVTFWETNVSDLRPLKNWKKLESIELRLTKVTDYTPLHGLSNLKSIATNRRLINNEQLGRLKRALPNCKFEIESRNLQRE
ncbi:MAG: leucine-rich repeat domain-containing protein [Verrucomicrobia subdivision 3 bacterium]|nr:leucine-rich repeat domain-containing protein [Limisphaerales bacterium]